MGNRVENYLTDLAYALDYAYNAVAANTNTTSINIGQNTRVSPLTGDRSNVDIGGCSVVVGCAGTTTHCNDLIRCVLNLRNVANLCNNTTTVAACDIVTGHSAYNSSGTLIQGSIVCQCLDTITVTPNGSTAPSSKVSADIGDQFPQITIPAGCYPSSMNIGFNLTKYNPVQKSQQQCTANTDYNTATDITYTNNAATVTHNCRNIKITTPKGYYSAARTLTICGPDYYACSGNKDITPTTAANAASGSTSYAAGYYANPHGACYNLPNCTSTALSSSVSGNTVTVTVPIGYYGSGATKSGTVAAPTAANLKGSISNSNNKLAVTPCAGYWNGSTAAVTTANYYTTSNTTVGFGGSHTVSAGYQSQSYTVSNSITAGSGVTMSNVNNVLTAQPGTGYWSGGTASTGIAWKTNSGNTGLTNTTCTVSYVAGYYPNPHGACVPVGGFQNCKATIQAKGYVCICTAGYFAAQKIEYDTSASNTYPAQVMAQVPFVGRDGKIQYGTYIPLDPLDTYPVPTGTSCYLTDVTNLRLCYWDSYNATSCCTTINGTVTSLCIYLNPDYDGGEGYLYLKYRLYGTYTKCSGTSDHKYATALSLQTSGDNSYKYMWYHFVKIGTCSPLNQTWD